MTPNDLDSPPELIDNTSLRNGNFVRQCDCCRLTGGLAHENISKILGKKSRIVCCLGYGGVTTHLLWIYLISGETG